MKNALLLSLAMILVTTSCSVVQSQKGKSDSTGLTVVTEKSDSTKEAFVSAVPPHEIINKWDLLPNINQVNLMVVTPTFVTEKQLQDLCLSLRHKHQKYSRLVISVYADTDEGRKLAKDDFYDPGISVIRENWLALYTYDHSEGERIDFEPYIF